MDKISVMVVPVGGKPYKKEVENKLECFQEIVGGYIEVVTLEIGMNNGVMLIVNEEGKLNNLPINRQIFIEGIIKDTLRGDFVLCGADREGEFASLGEDKFEKYMSIFSRD